MIELISPKKIEKEKVLIRELKKSGMDYLDIDSVLGWNYVLDHIWLYKNIENYLQKEKSKKITIMDVGCGNSPFHNFLEKELKVNIIGIDRSQGFCHQEIVTNADYFTEFLEFEEYEKNSVDMIFWLSAIEHNEIDIIKQLYYRSLYFLKPGGLLLITFPISLDTYWFESSQQTNFSISGSKKIFNDNVIDGEYKEVIEEYRANRLMLKDKYEKRYGHFDTNDPEFIVGGLKQIKF